MPALMAGLVLGVGDRTAESAAADRGPGAAA